MKQEGFDMKKDRILPSLDSAAKMRRYKWAQSWWLFWLSVMSIPSSTTRVALIHMDEKWFYAV